MSSRKVVTGKVRLSYVTLFTPRSQKEGQPAKYSVLLLIPKSDTKTVNAIKAAIEVAKQEGAAEHFGGKVPAGLRTPLRDGDSERDDPEYQGHWFLNASSKNKPGVVDPAVQPILDTSRVYSGCYGRVSIDLYAYNNSGNKGIAAGLNNVQFLADGEPLSGRSRAESDFTAAEEDFLS